MKRHILLLLLVFIGINAMAQNLSTDVIDKKPIDIRGSRVYVEDNKLDMYSAAACFSSIGGVDRSKEYLKYRKGYKTGLGLTIGGASLAVVGFGAALGGFVASYFGDISTEAGDAVMIAGYFSVMTGSLCFLAGVPTVCVYKET